MILHPRILTAWSQSPSKPSRGSKATHRKSLSSESTLQLPSLQRSRPSASVTDSQLSLVSFVLPLTAADNPLKGCDWPRSECFCNNRKVSLRSSSALAGATNTRTDRTIGVIRIAHVSYLVSLVKSPAMTDIAISTKVAAKNRQEGESVTNLFQNDSCWNRQNFPAAISLGLPPSTA